MKYQWIGWAGLLAVGLALTAEPCLAGQAASRVGATICVGGAVLAVKALEFGEISPDAGGTVTVSTDGARTASSGITLLNSGGATFAAEFAVGGAAGATYSVGLPDSLSVTCGSDSMTATDFVCSSARNYAGGTGTSRIGATLIVGRDQAPGLYSGWFDVTVDYN